MELTSASFRKRLLIEGPNRVSDITVLFWIIKIASTAVGEATSDYLVRSLGSIPAVLVGFVGFVVTLVIQLSTHRFRPWAYWSGVVGVGVFGTMAADVLHVGFHIPYEVTSVLYAFILGAVFIVWSKTEHTLSIHKITSLRRELFYWAAVVATFAMGTAIGDLSATSLHLGYGYSSLLFVGIIALPAIIFFVTRRHAIFLFWFGYVATRPLGASFADFVGKAKSRSGLGAGDGKIAIVLIIAIGILVGIVTLRDAKKERREVI